MFTANSSRPTFADLLRRARRAAGLTQEELAERAGLSVRGISDLERGVRRIPRRETLDVLARALQLTDADRLAWQSARRQPAKQCDISVVPVLRMPRLVGREREIDVLHQAVEQAISGHGQVVVLAGEPGVGKTRLAEHLASYASDLNVRVMWGRCYDGEGAPAYWPWVQIIRTYMESVASDVLKRDLGDAASVIAQVVTEVNDRLPGLPPLVPLESDQARFLVFDSITRLMRRIARRKPLLLIIDDLHWADRSSLSLLSFVAREIGDSPVVILGTYRDSEVGTDDKMDQLCADLCRNPRFQRGFLTGLTRADVSQLIAEVLHEQPDDRVVSAVYERTEGNPFFVGEVMRLLLTDGRLYEQANEDAARITIPAGVKEVIRQRFRRLSHNCNEVLAAASVIGREFPLNVLEPITTPDRITLLAGLDEAQRARLIERVPDSIGRFQFSHVLVRETLYEELPSAKQARLHQRIGECLEQLHGDEIDLYVSDLAHHFFRAIPLGHADGKAVEYAIRAGDRAVSQFAFAEAVGFYERALEVLDLGGPTDREVSCDVLLKLGETHNHAGQYQEAQEAFHRAAATGRECHVPEYLGRAALGAAGLGIIGHTSPDHVRLLEEAVARLPAEDSSLRARVLARLAFSLRDSRTLERRRAIVDEAEGVARRIDDPSTLLYVLLAGHWALSMPNNLHERLGVATEIMDLCERSCERLLVPTAHAYRLFNLMELGDIPAVDEVIQSFSDLARELGQPQRLWLAATFQTMRLFMAGQLNDAENLANHTRTIGENPAPVLASDHHFVQTLLVRREQARVGELMTAAAEIDRRYPSDLFWQSLLTIVDSELNREEAHTRFDRLVQAIERDHPYDPQVVVAAALMTSTSLVSRDQRHAAMFYELLRPYEGRNVVRPASIYWFGPISHYLGLLASSLDDLEHAERHFEDAIAMNRRMGTRPYLAHSQYALSQMLTRRGKVGDRDRARHLTTQALKLAHQLGMSALESRIRYHSATSPVRTQNP